MRFKNRIFHNADTAVASGGASLADSMAMALSSRAAVNPFNTGTQVVYSSQNGQTSVTPIVSSAPAPEMPPAAAPAQPTAPVQEPPAQAPPAPQEQPPAAAAAPANDPTEGGKYLIIRNPENGQFITRVKNDPEVIANFIANDKMFIRHLRSGAPQQPQAQAPPAPAQPTADQVRAADIQRAKKAAAHFLRADPNAQIDPLAETLADFLGDIRGEVRGEFESREQVARQAQVAAQQDQELAQVMHEDPSFSLDARDVIQLRMQYPHAGPKEIQAMRIYQQWQYYRANQPANPQNHPAPPAPVQQPQQPQPPGVPDQTWAQPTGSYVASQTGWDTHPYVVAAIDSHKRLGPMLGRAVTPESIARIKQIAIDTVKNTEAAKGGFR